MKYRVTAIPAILLSSFLTGCSHVSPRPSPLVRLANLEIKPQYLNAYKEALKEEIRDSIRIEPGVLALRAVEEKNNPTRITLMEIYADADAYNAHIEAPHFQKYKVATQHMVKSLKLVEVVPILLGEK